MGCCLSPLRAAWAVTESLREGQDPGRWLRPPASVLGLWGRGGGGSTGHR